MTPATSPPHPVTAAREWPQYGRLFFSVAPTQARAAGLEKFPIGKNSSRTHAGEGRRERNDSSAPNRCRTHAVEVLQDPAGRRHRCEPATNATTFSQPSCDALPQLPHRGPRQHRIRSPPLHDSESQRYSIRVSLAESVEAVCQPWPCVEPQRFGWIVA